MKKLIYIATMALGVLATSCADGFLDTLPNETIDSEIVNEIMSADVEQLQAYVTAGYDETYAANNSAENYDEIGMIAEIMLGEHMAGDLTFPTNDNWYLYDYQNDNRLSNYRRPKSIWTPIYYTITNCCNPVIEILGGLESLTDQTATILYQAYALRAFSYFRLINYFQQPYQVDPEALGVPLYTEDATKNIPGRATVAQIYEQILSDIDKAYQLAKGKGYQNGKSAVSEYSIALIYANILLFTGDYENAAKYAEEAAKGGALLTNAEDIIQNGFNSLDMSEVIWGYDVNTENTWYYYCFMAYMDAYGPGWGTMGCPHFIDSALFDQIGNNDVRKQWFGQGLPFLHPGYTPEYALTAQPTFISQGWTKYVPNKFWDVYLAGGGVFESDLIYFRVAEAYLVAAEAHYLNKDEANAKKWLNDLTKTRIEGYNCTLSGEKLYEEICLQKRIELWGEGKRLFDVKRRNESVNRTGRNHADPLLNANFNGQDKIMIFQLPDKELDNNEFITPDQQNP